MKQDHGKARYDLIEWRTIDDMANIMAAGAAAHGDQGWKTLTNAEDRYFSAAMRHLVEWRSGNIVDTDSGHSHLAHVMCNIMFLSELDRMAAARAEVENIDCMRHQSDRPTKSIKFTLADGAGSD